MRVGVLRSVADIGHGGIFQYEKACLAALGEIRPRVSAEIVYLTHLRDDLRTLSRGGGLSYHGLLVSFLDRPRSPPVLPSSAPIEAEPAPLPPIDPDDIFYDRDGAESLRSARIDLVFQLSPSANTFSLGLPFVMPIFDLNHRLQPEFTEVSADGEYEKREYFYRNVCRFATLVLVDSEVGREDVLRFYGDYIDEDRIRVVPYYPPIARAAEPDDGDRARVASAYRLPRRFFFYPAQFWSHKNHALIVKALPMLAGLDGDPVQFVFTGSYADPFRARNFSEIMGLAEKLGVRDRLHHIGSAPEADMPALYSLSAGLVMPTFFGPTNIPPFEAWHYGRPVVTSDIPGIREQIGEAGLLVDPRSPEALAEALARLWQDPELTATLVEAGRRRLSHFSWQSYLDGISGVVEEACHRVRTGTTPAFPTIGAG